MNSQSGGPLSLSECDLKISHNLQLTCELTVQRPIQLIRIWPQTMPWSPTYLWIHNPKAHSANSNMTSNYAIIFNSPVIHNPNAHSANMCLNGCRYTLQVLLLILFVPARLARVWWWPGKGYLGARLWGVTWAARVAIHPVQTPS